MFRTVLVVSVIYVCAVEASVFTSDQESNIEEYIERILQCRNIPGLTVSVVKGGEAWARGFGLADLKNGRRVDNTTVFFIGSLGKAFTMTLLGEFLQEKGFDWNTKLNDISDVHYEFPDEERTREVTLADLLTHRTGLSAVADYGFIGGYPVGTTMKTMVNRIKYVPVQADLGDRFIYNNLMYMTLGHVTETLGDDSWDHLMTSKLLEPIGMDGSSILKSSNEVLHNNSAKPYIYEDGMMKLGTAGIYKITPLEPAGSIKSTGLDMAKWMNFNLQNATTADGANLVSYELFSEAFQEQIALSTFTSAAYSIKTPRYPVDDITSGYGFAWFTANYRDHKKIWHSGGLFSYVSLLWLYPDDGVGIFASTNGPGLPTNSGTALNTIFWYLSDLLLGFDPWLDIDTACSFPGPWENKTMFNVPPPEEIIKDNLYEFVGTYGSNLLPDVTVSLENESTENGQRLRFEMNRIKGDLYPAKVNDSFGFQMTDPWEYAIERVINENFTVRYPLKFFRTSDNEVFAFNVTFGAGVVIPFRKDLRFLTGTDQMSGASSLIFSVVLMISACCLT